MVMELIMGFIKKRKAACDGFVLLDRNNGGGPSDAAFVRDLVILEVLL